MTETANDKPADVDGSAASLGYPPLSFGSLFAGIGGFDLGFERAGMVCKWQVEIDDYANRVLAKHWPNVRRWPDVRTWPQQDTERVDVICGGFPCQDISYAGKQAGIDGERSGLWREYLRIVREIRPRFVVMENVAALFVRGMDRVCGDMAASGYNGEWFFLPASSFGAPHFRCRVFAVFVRFASDSTSERLDGKRTYERIILGLDTPASIGWEAEPDVCRVDDGISEGLDARLKALGNAVVPQVAEWIGRRIVESAGRTPAPECQCR